MTALNVMMDQYLFFNIQYILNTNPYLLLFIYSFFFLNQHDGMLRIPYLGFSSSLNRVSFPFDIRGSNNCLDLMTVHGDMYNAVPAAHIWNIQNYSCPVRLC